VAPNNFLYTKLTYAEFSWNFAFFSVPGEWTAFPDIDCDTVTFEPATFDLADNDSPGNTFFHVRRDMGAFSIRVPGRSGVLWGRTNDGTAITFFGIQVKKRKKAQAILAGLYAPRWCRQITRLKLDRFEPFVRSGAFQTFCNSTRKRFREHSQAHF